MYFVLLIVSQFSHDMALHLAALRPPLITELDNTSRSSRKDNNTNYCNAFNKLLKSEWGFRGNLAVQPTILSAS